MCVVSTVVLKGGEREGGGNILLHSFTTKDHADYALETKRKKNEVEHT